MDDVVSSKMGDRKLNDFEGFPEKISDEINQSSDSLSSSASISDSDITSTDSDDSLALSESESITDVTPLNSPYCNSPLPQSRHIECKSEEKSLTSRNVDYESASDHCHRPEMNVLMKAIEKLELEAKNNSEFGFRETIMRRRAASFSNEEAKRIEQENQRLFKRVISQQNRIRSIYSASNQPRNQDLVQSDGDISESSKKSVAGKFPKRFDKAQAQRKQKCLSHPSSFIYSCKKIEDKKNLKESAYPENKEKKKHPISSGMACPQKANCYREGTENSVERNEY